MAIGDIETPDASHETLGQRLRRLRKEAHLSQDALGARAGVTGQMIYLVESGKQKAILQGSAEVLAQALGVTPTYLLYGTETGMPHDHPPIEVYLRQTRPGLTEDDVRSIARLVRALDAEQRREMEGNGDADRNGSDR